MTTMTDKERQEFLAGIGLKDKGAGLAADVTPTAPAKILDIALAPQGVDPHTMPVTDIVFDPALLDGFPDLTGSNMSAASRHVFELYKSPGRDKDRNSLLHRRIGEFIGQVRRSRDTGGFIKEKVKSTRDARDLAALLTEHNITAADLAVLIQEKGQDA